MYTVVGSRTNRTFRVLWALEELGLEYDHKPYAVRSPEALEHSPTGKLPALIAEGELITDSAAIITFLADRHGGLTFPAGSVQRAKQDALLHRVNDEIDAVLWTAARHSFILPEVERVPAVKESLKLEFARSLDRLMEQIDGPYLMGDTMTIPDIILAHCGGWAYNAKFPLENEAFKTYTKRLRERDAFKRAAALP
ncbi:MAG: glutathione S-transferase family protein [Paracoccaceae bacterium]|jgi:glutathione S-transferase